MEMKGMKMKEAGYKPPKEEKGMDMPMPMEPKGSGKDEKQYASIYADSREMPGVEDMEPGKDYLVMIKVRCTRTEMSEQEDGEKRAHVSMSVRECGMKPVSGKKASEMTDDELGKAAKGEMMVEEE
jgi:hypothetical protein